MRQLRAILLAGISLTVAAAMASDFVAPSTAEAAQPIKRGNWTSARAKRANKSVRPPRRIDFLDIFGGVNRPVSNRTRRSGFWSNSFFGASSRWGGRPTLLAPDTPVIEYVEKPKIYVYPQPQLVALKNARLTGDPEWAINTAILETLRSGAARVRVSATHRRAIISFYKERNFAPIWVSGTDVLPRAQLVMALLSRAQEHGLKNEHYRIPIAWENAGNAAAITASVESLARLDVELTAMALRFAHHISGGVVHPNKLSSYHDLKPPRVTPATALNKLAQAEDPAAWLESLAPRHFAYELMKQELAKLRSSAGEELLPPIPVGKLIRPGMRDERVLLVRRHLRKLGLLDDTARKQAEPVTAEPTAASDDAPVATVQVVSLTAGPALRKDLYDAELVAAVKRFQKMAGLKPDGIIGKGTISALNRRNSVDTRQQRIRKLVLNMERLRWMPRDFGNPHFLVNVPAFEVYLYDNGRIKWKSRVVVGKPKNQTAFFSDEIEIVVFNPYWGVPQSIIRKEFIPKLMRDPTWLDREGFEVRDRKGRRISSAAVNWAAYRNAKVIPFDVRQLPGDKNALGRLKVLFPNKHAIYMHDTPAKELFSRSVRAFSHGCVRVQKPRELAELVSGLDPFEIEQYLKAGKNKRIKLKRTTPVHLAYFTAWPDDKGRLRYYDDIYGRDKLLETALKKHDAAYRRVIVQAQVTSRYR